MTTTTLKQRFALLQERRPEISQADLARLCGAKPPSVNAWFSGETKSMRAETAAKVAAVYGVSPIWLATGEVDMDHGLPDSSTNMAAGLDAIRPPASHNAAPVFHWARIEEVLYQSNVNFTSEPRLPVPPGAPARCKWFTLESDQPRFRLYRGNRIAVSPVDDPADCKDGHLHLFKKADGAFILGDYRKMASGYEVLPDSGMPIESDRHGVIVVGRVHGSWFGD